MHLAQTSVRKTAASALIYCQSLYQKIASFRIENPPKWHFFNQIAMILLQKMNTKCPDFITRINENCLDFITKYRKLS